jgi:hypothetical protein
LHEKIVFNLLDPMRAWEEFESERLKASTYELTKAQVHCPLESPCDITSFVIGVQSSK